MVALSIGNCQTKWFVVRCGLTSLDKLENDKSGKTASIKIELTRPPFT